VRLGRGGGIGQITLANLLAAAGLFFHRWRKGFGEAGGNFGLVGPFELTLIPARSNLFCRW
jgi:hypothetical protein